MKIARLFTINGRAPGAQQGEPSVIASKPNQTPVVHVLAPEPEPVSSWVAGAAIVSFVVIVAAIILIMGVAIGALWDPFGFTRGVGR